MSARTERAGPDRGFPLGFAAPGLVLLLLFLVLPFLLAVGFSCTDQRLLAPPDLGARFVGLRNYARLVQDHAFWAAARNNLYFAAVVTPVQTGFALGLALLVNRRLPGVRLLRAVYFLPVAATMAVVTVVWSLLFAPDPGVVNRLIHLLSFGAVGPHDWLRDPRLVLPAVMAISIWQGVGFQMLVFLAGLQAIPEDLYEAATLDGAGPLRRFRHITLPLLRRTTVFVLVTTTIYAFQLFTQVQIIASGGASAPVDAFRTLVLLLVREGFQMGRIGPAAAISVLFFLAVLGISLAQRALLRDREAER
jgi:multiple sugar transport system permease protein